MWNERQWNLRKIWMVVPLWTRVTLLGNSLAGNRMQMSPSISQGVYG